MTMYEQDMDVVCWGLHPLVDACSFTNNGYQGTITCYDKDFSDIGYVNEGYSESIYPEVENDPMIAYAYQEELSRVAAAEALGSSNNLEEHQQESILAQDWHDPSGRYCNSVCEDADGPGQLKLCPTSGEFAVDEEDEQGLPEIDGESALDGEVGKRLNQMVSVPHVPRINGEIPSVDEATSDHQRLLDRLQLYDLVELKVSGDGNCQFRALSDQIYRTPEHHEFVRQQIVNQVGYYVRFSVFRNECTLIVSHSYIFRLVNRQLKSQPELYEGYVPMAYEEYLKRMSETGEWGDHVTLQAAADSFGFRIFVITSFKDTCYIEILPRIQKSNRVVTLSFWAEVHYNSIYPPGDLPTLSTQKKKWWWPGN